jgi:hypothetical protein
MLISIVGKGLDVFMLYEKAYLHEIMSLPPTRNPMLRRFGMHGGRLRTSSPLA